MVEFTTTARPYAGVLLRVAKVGNLDAWSELVSEMRQIVAVPDMKTVVDDPKLSKADMAGIFLSALKSPVLHEAKELAGLLVASKRLSPLLEIVVQFHVLRNISEDATDVKITSAFPFEGASLTELVATLERKFGEKLQAHVSVDPSSTGGARVQTGDEALDTSVRVRLTQMQSVLTAA